MKNKCLVFCSLLFLVFIGYSQQNYLPGIIIRSNGDTLHGLINYLNTEKNPLNVYFKTDKDHDYDIFSPMEVQSFMVENEIYTTATVTLNKGLYRTQELEYSPALSLSTETVFLQTLVTGKKSLFYYKDEAGREQFFLKTDSGYQLLIHHKYLVNPTNSGDVAGNNVIREDKRYIGQVSYYLGECQEIRQELQDLKYSKQSMVNAFRKYYDCIGTNAGFVKKSDEPKATFGVFAGLSLTKLKFSGEDPSFDELINSDFPVSPNVTFGVYLNKKFARNLGRLSLHNELLFSGYKTEAFYQEVVNENRYVDNYITFGGMFIKLNNMFQYSLPVKNFSLFMRLGITNVLNINEINEQEVVSVFYSTETINTYPAVDGSKMYAFGLLGGLGASYNRFSLDMRYEQNSGMSDITSLKSAIGTFYILLGYRF